MSTRRARIKAVTSLPPRRKNADNNAQPKPVQLKDEAPKITKSPRTPRSASKESSDKASRPTPGLVPLPSTPTLQNRISSPAKRPETPKINISRTPKVAEKVSVITSASASIKSLFASPPPRTDSPFRNTASPIVSKLTTKIFKPTTPQKDKPSLGTTVEGGDIKFDSKNTQVKDKTGADNKSDLPDDYNVPSVPESLTDEAVMDGIVPLQPTRSMPKPIDLLKNEIISEHAEVNFDPIVPLPSPSKVRPKLRPIPRLAPLRRNSIQGSASESEDESRRALLGGGSTPAPSRQRLDSHTSHSTMQSTIRDLHRARNDSVCSSVSQSVSQAQPATSPVKEAKHSKTRRQEMTRRMNAMRRRRETVQRDTLTMYDLIFYNPTSNPIIPDQDEINAKEANKKEEAEREAAQAEEPDDPPPGDGAPVPQIKLGPNGEIVLDEKSLVIKQTESKRKVSGVVREGAWGGGGGKYSRAARTADWSAAETVRFYRAVAAIGTDFSLMAPLFPDRTRRDLKIKFKKEEKVNGTQLDKALRSATTWDAVRLQEEFTQERELAAKKAEIKRDQLLKQKIAERERLTAAREHNIRQSRGSKALENSSIPSSFKDTANDLIQRAAEAKRHNRRRRQIASETRLDVELNNQQENPYATITLVNKHQAPKEKTPSNVDMATISRVNPITKTTSPIPITLNSNIASVPSNIESGSLVVLTVNDPNSPSKKMLQTYIAHGGGKLTPISLPSTFLNSVVGYMKKGTPKSGTSGSPQVSSPVVQTPDGKRSATPSVIQVNQSPAKRQRHSSYTITQL